MSAQGNGFEVKRAAPSRCLVSCTNVLSSTFLISVRISTSRWYFLIHTLPICESEEDGVCKSSSETSAQDQNDENKASLYS